MSKNIYISLVTQFFLLLFSKIKINPKKFTGFISFVLSIFYCFTFEFIYIFFPVNFVSKYYDYNNRILYLDFSFICCINFFIFILLSKNQSKRTKTSNAKTVEYNFLLLLLKVFFSCTELKCYSWKYL